MTINKYDQEERKRFYQERFSVEMQNRVAKRDARNAALETMRDVELVCERIRWLCNGTFGRGAQLYARDILHTGKPFNLVTRFNRVAALVQLVLLCDDRCPQSEALRAWRLLSKPEQEKLRVAVAEQLEAEIENEVTRQREANNEPKQPEVY